MRITFPRVLSGQPGAEAGLLSSSEKRGFRQPSAIPMLLFPTFYPTTNGGTSFQRAATGCGKEELCFEISEIMEGGPMSAKKTKATKSTKSVNEWVAQLGLEL
jgi:hypothetical protein